MKNIVVTGFLLSSFVLNGMDQCEDFAFRINGTIIQVNRKSIKEIDGTVGVIVTSFERQLFLSDCGYRFATGEMRRVRDNILKFDQEEDMQMKSTAIVIAEPLYDKLPGGVTFETLCNSLKEQKSDAAGKEKHERMMEQLVFCYENVFSKIAAGVEELKNNKTIAIEALGQYLGFAPADIAPVALQGAIDFANLNPKVYDKVYLLVKEDSDLPIYRQWIDQYFVGLKQKQQK